MTDQDAAWHAPTSEGGGAWVVLPTYNERENLPVVLERLRRAAPAARVLVVDDGSPDGTGQLADELSKADSRIEVLHRTAKEGLGAAYRAGFAVVLDRPDTRAVVQMDCDLSHSPDDVPRLLAALAAGSDLAIGSRYVRGGGTPGWSPGRRVISRGGSLFARTVLGVRIRDLTGGFKAWRPATLSEAMAQARYARGYGFQVEMTWRAHCAGARIAELPITFSERLAGESKMSGAIVLEAMLMVLRLRLESLRRGG
jgi:dolichol-phosphate mannosyltransferase